MAGRSFRIRDLGYSPGTLPTGQTNSILDVSSVHVSQVTVKTGPGSSKGITIITPRPPEKMHQPSHAGFHVFNGNGELTGMNQVADWAGGFINTPIAFTNSLSLGEAFSCAWDFVLDVQDSLQWDEETKSRHYGTPVVGESCGIKLSAVILCLTLDRTADWIINGPDVRLSRLNKADIKKAFELLKDREGGGVIQEGQHGIRLMGGGAGMTCAQFPGGTGTASRVIEKGKGGERSYTLGCLVQTNYGLLQDFVIGGVPIGRLLMKEQADKPSPSTGGVGYSSQKNKDRVGDGSILILLITDAPLAPHQLNRIARHATAGLARVGSYGIGRNFSGDIFLAVSTAEHGPEQMENVALQRNGPTQTYETKVVKSESIDAYFYATAEAVEEAILNSIVAGGDVTCMDGSKIDGLPIEKVKALLEKHFVQV